MSAKHPVIAITGASGAGTSTIESAFKTIFKRESLNVGMVKGDSFHRYNRLEMRAKVSESKRFHKRVFTHYCEQANHLKKLENLFYEYGVSGTGDIRFYVHNETEAQEHNERLGVVTEPGHFTPWETLPKGTDLLFYEGLHGGAMTKTANVFQNVDLLVGVVPCINIEWMQKIWRDSYERPYTPEQATQVILERMEDYVEFITPQFDRTHISIHRVPLVDTGNPISYGNPKPPPKPEESLAVITLRSPMFDVQSVLDKIKGAFMSNEQTLVVPGQHLLTSVDLLIYPAIKKLISVSKLLDESASKQYNAASVK